MQTLVERLSEALALGLFESRLLASFLVIVLLVLVRPLLMAIIGRRTTDVSALYRWRKVLEYSSLVIGLIFLAEIWLVGGRSVATYLGLLSAGLAIALKDPISNLFGWLFIITRRPFEVGDRIEIDGAAGDVIDVRYFQFSLMEIGNWVQADQSTGRIIHVPNQKVFSEPLANFTKGFGYIWHEIEVLITFESDWRRAKTLLEEVVGEHTASLSEAARERLKEAARRYLISYDKLTPIVYTKVVASGVRLTMRYLCDPRRRRGTEMEVWEAVLDAFDAEPQIELAYPTQRVTFGGGEQARVTENHKAPVGKQTEENG